MFRAIVQAPDRKPIRGLFPGASALQVAVGISVTRYLPHRSQACGITALGSCLRSNAETLIRVWVYHFGCGNPLHHLALHLLPSQASTFLASPAQGMQPCVADLRSESVQCFSVAGDSVTIEMSHYYATQPSSLFRYWFMPMSVKSLADFFNFASQPFTDGFALKFEFPIKSAC